MIQSIETLHVEGLPLDLPSTIEVDVSVLTELESSIHVRDIEIAANVTITNEPQSALAMPPG